MPQKPAAAPKDPVAAIEEMIERGMNEEQIMAALGRPNTPATRIAAGSAMGAKSIGPPKQESGIVPFIKKWAGIESSVGPITESERTNQGTVPIPGTNQRVLPGRAALAGMDVASGVQFLRALPAFARNILQESAPGLLEKLSPAPARMNYGVKVAEAAEAPAARMRFGVKEPVADAVPPTERFPSPMDEWLAESTKGTPSPGPAGINPEFPFSSSELSYDVSKLPKPKRVRR